jgi:hypothetical protein
VRLESERLQNAIKQQEDAMIGVEGSQIPEDFGTS